MEESWETCEMALIERAARRGVPINASLELLPLCNMDCKMCYVRLSKSQMNAQGRMRSAKEWLSLGKELKNAGTLFVILTGGEPLLHPEFKEIYLGLKELGMIVTINTNGTLIDEGWADFFSQHLPRRINITLYGSDAKTYGRLCGYEQGYERAISAIKLLKDRRVAVKVNGSLVRENANEMDSIVQTALGLGAAVHIDTYMYPAERERNKPFDLQSRLSPEEAGAARVHFDRLSMSKERFKALRDERLWLSGNTPKAEAAPGKMHCQAGRTSFTVNWQGMMRPCVMLTEPSIPVFETGFASAWETLRERVESIRLSSECSSCGLRAVCQTCAACALYDGGSFGAVPRYMCRYTKAMLSCLEADADLRCHD